MQSDARAAWTKPQLMAIVRMHGDEAVLDNCKTAGAGAALAQSDVFGECAYTPGIGCATCNAIVTS